MGTIKWMGEKLYKLFGLIGSLRLLVTLQPGSGANTWELIRASNEPSLSADQRIIKQGTGELISLVF